MLTLHDASKLLSSYTCFENFGSERSLVVVHRSQTTKHWRIQRKLVLCVVVIPHITLAYPQPIAPQGHIFGLLWSWFCVVKHTRLLRQTRNFRVSLVYCHLVAIPSLALSLLCVATCEEEEEQQQCLGDVTQLGARVEQLPPAAALRHPLEAAL